MQALQHVRVGREICQLRAHRGRRGGRAVPGHLAQGLPGERRGWSLPHEDDQES